MNFVGSISQDWERENLKSSSLVSIICGAGGHVLLSKKWIGKQPNAANVPKARQRFATAAFSFVKIM